MHRNAVIAVVDDEASVRESLALALSSEGYAVRTFVDGESALDALLPLAPDAIILDIVMPKMDGVEFCRRYRETHRATPVIFISSKGSETDKIEALEQGGDDYLVKPYSLAELLTRLRVCLDRVARLSARAGTNEEGTVLNAGRFILRVESWEAEYRGTPLALTVTEYRMLKRLVSAPDRVFDRDSLIGAAYPDDAYVADRNVDAHIKRLRKKVRAVDPDFDGIETVYGIGYRYRREDR